MEIDKYSKQMDKTISHLENEFQSLHLWRASTWLVENIDIFVQSWWMKQKLNQLWNISIMDSQTIKIESWDKSIIPSIEKWIYDSGTWLTPSNQGDYIMIKIPPLTKERRMELTKYVHELWEENKIALRNIRHEALKEIKKEHDEKTISEDDKKRLEKELDELTKKFNQKIDTEVKNKQNEIMNI